MWRQGRELLLDLACQFPGWAFLAAGITIIALTLLIPAYLQNRELVWQRDLLKLQAQRFSEQEQAYRQMNAAIDSGDPTLLTRLAYHYLRLKPAGTNILAFRPVSADGRQYAPPVAIAERYTTAETWLQRPLPKVGVDYPNYSPVESLLVRVVTSPLRGVFLLAGLLSLGLSLIPLDRQHRPTTRLGFTSAGLALIRPQTVISPTVVAADTLETSAPLAVEPAPMPVAEAVAIATPTRLGDSTSADEASAQAIAVAPALCGAAEVVAPLMPQGVPDAAQLVAQDPDEDLGDPSAAPSIRPPDDAL